MVCNASSFTRPKDEDMQYIDSDPGKVHAIAYDIVLNGYELGGGSLRIYDGAMQDKMFEVLGFTEEKIQENFGWFVDAFKIWYTSSWRFGIWA